MTYLKEYIGQLKPSKILEFPELRQVFNYDCGACALQSVLAYYGVEKREDELIAKMETTKTEEINIGTRIAAIKDAALYYGLDCRVVHGMTIEQVTELLDKNIPTIILLQAWRDFTNLSKWKADFKDGHYVVAVGYEGTNMTFEDPSSFCRTYLSFEEMKERWHAVNDKNQKDFVSVGIVVIGTPVFDHNKKIHMD
jgi:ABC-type bacteriocin/lantibiotic exporter with double-glycine peptidase domain